MAVHEYVRTQRPANTQRAYATDWKVWTRYVTELGIPEDSATAGALVGFVVWLERQEAAPTTVDRRLAGAVVGLRQRGAKPLKAATEAARAALNGYRRRLTGAGEKRGRGRPRRWRSSTCVPSPLRAPRPSPASGTAPWC
ncbi:site-specific integrase [Lentzea sp. NPDC042327]|uniref:site-specific integrase n=1 Tax=Lentzea sp. NPDC042327 TaxID=3154801 RepID=UPI0033C04B88